MHELTVDSLLIDNLKTWLELVVLALEFLRGLKDDNVAVFLELRVTPTRQLAVDEEDPAVVANELLAQPHSHVTGVNEVARDFKAFFTQRLYCVAQQRIPRVLNDDEGFVVEVLAKVF